MDDEPRYGWVVVGAAFVSLAVIFGVAYSFAALFESFEREFAANRADVALVFGLCGLIYFLLGAGAGMLADRFGPRLVCSAGMLFIAAGLLATSFAASLATVYLGYGVVVGIGVGLVYAPAIGGVQPWFTRRRGTAAGIASAGIGAGTLVVPLLAAQAIVAVEWRDALRLIAAGVVVSSAWARRCCCVRRRLRGGVAGVRSGVGLRDALRSRRFHWYYLFVLLAAPTMFIPFAHVSAAARDLGIGDTRSVGLISLLGVGSLAGRFGIGLVADRLGSHRHAGADAGVARRVVRVVVGGGRLSGARRLRSLGGGSATARIVSLMPAICMNMFGARAVASIVGTLYTGAALGQLCSGRWRRRRGVRRHGELHAGDRRLHRAVGGRRVRGVAARRGRRAGVLSMAFAGLARPFASLRRWAGAHQARCRRGLVCGARPGHAARGFACWPPRWPATRSARST